MQNIFSIDRITRNHTLWILSLLLLTFSISAKEHKSQTPEAVWVTAKGECYVQNITSEAAKSRALKNAQENAIRQVNGEIVSAYVSQIDTSNVQGFNESLTQLSQSTLRGYIVDQKEPDWKLDELSPRPGAAPIPIFRVTWEVKVAKEKGKRDPNFEVSLKLNNETFREGEEIILSIKPTQDCYITVFNILSDHTVLILYPPQQQTPEVVRGKQWFTLPTEAERRRGIRYRVGLLPNRIKDVESLYVIATKTETPFQPTETKEFRPDISGQVVLPTYQVAFEEIGRWLVNISANQRAFDLKRYEIRKR
jgi:hypothetical protein